jgi:DNA-directed RNA polymerase
MTPDSTPRIYDALNKLQRTGFSISPRIFEVYEELFSRSDRELLFSTEFVPPKESPFKHDK